MFADALVGLGMAQLQLGARDAAALALQPRRTDRSQERAARELPCGCCEARDRHDDQARARRDRA